MSLIFEAPGPCLRWVATSKNVQDSSILIPYTQIIFPHKMNRTFIRSNSCDCAWDVCPYIIEYFVISQQYPVSHFYFLSLFIIYLSCHLFSDFPLSHSCISSDMQPDSLFLLFIPNGKNGKRFGCRHRSVVWNELGVGVFLCMWMMWCAPRRQCDEGVIHKSASPRRWLASILGFCTWTWWGDVSEGCVGERMVGWMLDGQRTVVIKRDRDNFESLSPSIGSVCRHENPTRICCWIMKQANFNRRLKLLEEVENCIWTWLMWIRGDYNSNNKRAHLRWRSMTLRADMNISDATKKRPSEARPQYFSLSVS